ncbi:MAG: hypothetical protein NTZ98_15750 [Acidobacteria bacterium]|jgi:Tol biopolymer transport system component|nr:hypothetical protein [Acidobacteriota bacterium]
MADMWWWLLLGVFGQQAGQKAARPEPPAVESRITVMAADGSARTVIYTAARHFEAPNWSPDGRWLVLNSRGRLYRLPLRWNASGARSTPVAAGEPEMIDTGPIDRLNNDHGISPDGRLLAISAGHIYTLPFAGGTPTQVTTEQPSYYHGWSPDGGALVYCARRDNNFDIYSIAVSGGPEKRLTSSPGYDDGPDYSPDGKWIYFNSDRGGSWDIWRIPASGGGEGDRLAERVTSDEMEDWFPHPSPDGKWLLFLSYPPGTKGHPANLQVKLRIMPLGGGPVRELDSLLGGQGTINVPSWSPRGQLFAYITYRLLGAGDTASR